MAKDPAFLFYPGDWQGGTLTFTRFLKGCYMDVLIAQFNNGHLSLEEIKTVLGSDFGQAWPTLQKKFVQDARGLFFNERLDTEMFKRKEYSKSRAENRKGKNKKHMNNISKTHVESYVKHMENENGNEDTNEVTFLSKEWWSSIFDDVTMENYKINFKVDVDQEFKLFQVKVKNASDDYRARDTAGMRNAFQWHLMKCAQKPNRNTSISPDKLQKFKSL